LNENQNNRAKNSTNNNTKSKTNAKKFNYKKTKNKCQSALSLFTMGVASVSLATFEMADYYHAKTENINAKSINEKQIEQEQMEEIKLGDVAEEHYRDDAKEVTASKLLNDYWLATTLDEWKKVEKKYGDQYIEVTGEIKSIKTESYDGAFIMLENDKPISNFSDFMNVQCIFHDKEDIKEMKKLEEGEVVTVNGYCNGSEYVTISVYDCEIKDKEKEIER
jgi:hypothetical protein